MAGNSRVGQVSRNHFVDGTLVQYRWSTLSRRVLWEMVLFLVVSICAYTIRDVCLFDLVSEPTRQLLGYPPPAWAVSIALTVYCFSSFSLTLTAMARGAEPEKNWNQLGYRSAFYLFYAFSGTISDNFPAVLLIGLALYACDQCHVWHYGRRQLMRR